jgi:hypothetical protein
LSGDYYPLPPARLALLNASTGQACSYDQTIAEAVSDRVEWQPDGQLLVQVGGQAYLGLPCAGELQSTEAPAAEEDPALSPGGDYRAETTVQSSSVGIQTLRTDLLALPDRQVILSAEWQIDERLGELGLGGEWLGGNQFLIYETLDSGPLLLTVSGETLPVASDLFGIEKIPSILDPEGVSLRAAGRGLQDSLDYHLVLYGVGAEASFPPVRLYHSETGSVEEMPFTHLWSPAFSVDGRWLLLDERPIQDGYETSALWIRAIDPPGSSVGFFAGGFPAAWAPAWDRAAFAHEGTVNVLSFPDGQPLGVWEIGGYHVANFLWSPDGSSLAALAAIPGEEQMGLFLIHP